MKLPRLVLAFLLLLACTAFPEPALALNGNISWDPVTTYVDGVAIESGKTVYYEVFRATKADLSDAVKISPADHQTTSFTDTSLTPNKTYYFYVRAYLVPSNPGLSSDSVFLRTFPPGKTGRVVVVVTN